MTNKLGFWSIVLLGINTILGSGIFLLPGSFYIALRDGGALSSIIVIGTVLTISLCFAEASGIFEGYGGPYIYVREAMGDFMGFQVGFMKWVISLLAWATMAVAFANLLVEFLDIAHIPYIQKVVAGALILSLSYVNLLGVELTKSLNNIVTLGKLVPILLFVLLGMRFIGGVDLTLAPVDPGHIVEGIKDPILILFYAFTGFESIAVAARDMKTPLRNLPRGIITVMTAITLLYTVIALSILGILKGNISPDSYPIFHAAYLLMGPLGGGFFSSGIIMSVVGINIASSFTSPRSIVALSEKGSMPEILARKNKYGAPGGAILLTGGLSLLIVLIGSFNTLASFSVFSRTSQYLLTCLAVIIFKRRGMKGSLTLPRGYLIPLTALISMGILFYSYVVYIGAAFLVFFLIGRYLYRYDKKGTHHAEEPEN